MSRPGWMIDELAYAGEEHLDVDYVAGYDRKSQTDHSGDLEMLFARGLGPESIVVDLGAGITEHDRIDGLEMGGIRRELEIDGLAFFELDRASDLILQLGPAGITEVIYSLREVLADWTSQRNEAILVNDTRLAMLWDDCPRSAAVELARSEDYDHVVVNETGQVDRTAATIDAILEAERSAHPRRRVRL